MVTIEYFPPRLAVSDRFCVSWLVPISASIGGVLAPWRRGPEHPKAAELAKSLKPEPISISVPRRRGNRPAMPNIKITSLDRRLYAWLGESDDKKFERAFSAYFSVAFPAVVRHLMRLSRWDAAQLEELAQDALLRFFQRAGRGRREASQAVQSALPRVQSLNFGPFHERQVDHWTHEVSSFRDSVMSFRLPEAEAPDDGNWKAAIRVFSDRIPVLTQQGCHILNAVRVELRWLDEPLAEIMHIDADERIACDLDETINGDVTGRCAAAKAFANTIATEVAAGSARARAALADHPGLVEFADGLLTIICVLPQLRVPTNGYLFEIAMTIYLDECKKRGRQKRGGSAIEFSSSLGTTPTHASESPHPIEMLTLDTEASGDDVDFEAVALITANANSTGGLSPLGVDPTLQYEHEDLFAKFYEYLGKPVADAAQACANAAGTRRAQAARHKLESLTNKLARTTAVLCFMGEGYTQEQTADQLAISRNQVKYIVELVQEAYARFMASSTRHAALASSLREQSNV
jgi:DNA-directed RNA polymerase specialized sigma24 family protein